MPKLTVPISQFTFGPSMSLAGGQWVRGTPTPGTALSNAVVGQAASCSNLVADSPPTLLERYELLAIHIGYASLTYFSGAPAAQPTITSELTLLVNDEVAYTAQDQQQPVLLGSGSGIYQYLASGSFIADLVNPIKVGARERLQLQVGINSNEGTIGGINQIVGAQVQGTGAAVANLALIPFDSTITYETVEVSARRRL